MGLHRSEAEGEAEVVKPWVLRFHTSAGYGETVMRFRTRAEARRYRDEINWGGGLVFYPVRKERK